MADAGLELDAVDGAVHTGVTGWGVDAYSRKLGLRTNFYMSIQRGGALSIEGVLLATQCSAPETPVTSPSPTATRSGRTATPHPDPVASRWWHQVWSEPTRVLSHQGTTAVPGGGSVHGFYASRHMHEYGTLRKISERWRCATANGRTSTLRRGSTNAH